MQKIITDKKPFVTERNETITLNKEIYLFNEKSVDELMFELARKRQIPEGLLPTEKAIEDRADQLIWKFTWYEVML